MKNKSIPNLKLAIQAICFLAFTLLVSNTCYSQVTSEKDSKLTANDLANISTFKASSGQNRKTLFEQIKPLIKSVDANGNNDEVTTSDVLVNLLGEPDVKISSQSTNTIVNVSSNSCKAIVGLNKEGLVTFCVIKDCQ
jgi:hypothetical protein